MRETRTEVEYVDGWKITNTYPVMTEEERKAFQDEIIIRMHKLFSRRENKNGMSANKENQSL